jgi:hypothetical protein
MVQEQKFTVLAGVMQSVSSVAVPIGVDKLAMLIALCDDTHRAST